MDNALHIIKGGLYCGGESSPNTTTTTTTMKIPYAPQVPLSQSVRNFDVVAATMAQLPDTVIRSLAIKQLKRQLASAARSKGDGDANTERAIRVIHAAQSQLPADKAHDWSAKVFAEIGLDARLPMMRRASRLETIGDFLGLASDSPPTAA